ncbi:diguanylate cyclase [Alteromonas aestuariivivens]|uniref:Diguanylate cyclase n=1 Tax=Alteromonas aestuariivivens TaxID=1938339 RepID=A0A3D8MEX0_9ALTE|nr:diguanylate cyclase [Alteromonas aestuariivivens]
MRVESLLYKAEEYYVSPCKNYRFYRCQDNLLLVEIGQQAPPRPNLVKAEEYPHSRRQTPAQHTSSRPCWLCLTFDGPPPGWLLSGIDHPEFAHQRQNFLRLLDTHTQLLRLMVSHNSLLSDPLTQLNSRVVLQSELGLLCEHHSVGLIMIHCRDFHSINQKFGHAAGDRVITEISAQLKRVTRNEDLLCRFGGALFGVGLPVNHADETEQVARKLQDSLQSQQYLDNAVSLCFSTGLATLMFDESIKSSSEKAGILISRADQALKAAQQQSEPSITSWKSGHFSLEATQFGYLGGIFTADTVTDYRNMLLLWDISSIIADENDFQALLQQVIHRLAQTFDFHIAGLYTPSQHPDSLLLYEINNNDEAVPFAAEHAHHHAILESLTSNLTQSQQIAEFEDNDVIAVLIPLSMETEDFFYFRAHPNRFSVTQDTKVLLCGLTRQMGKALRRARLEAQFNKQLVTQKERLQTELEELKENIKSSLMVFRSESMHHLMRQAKRAALTDTTVLILGESGTGKERLMHAIHKFSPRREKPFVIVDCGSIPETLIESELFGHAKGAFTGAQKSSRGKFQEADGGVLALDEIGELPLAMQTKLLRFVQEKHFTPVGSHEYIRVDVKIIAVTNRDLMHEVQQGRFRKDLYYRLNVVTLHSPPLRERKEDIPLLARHFLNRYAKQYDNENKFLSEQALAKMQQYDWPGNIRELENRLMQAALLTDTQEIRWQDLNLDPQTAATLPSNSDNPALFTSTNHFPPPIPSTGKTQEIQQAPCDVAAGFSLPEADSQACLTKVSEALKEVLQQIQSSAVFFHSPVGIWLEDEILQQTFVQQQGNVKATAIQLHMSQSTARRRIDKIGQNGSDRPPAWAEVQKALAPIAQGKCIIDGCLDTLKLCLLQQLLASNPSSMSLAAEILGVSEPTLYKWKKKLTHRQQNNPVFTAKALN